MFMTEWRCTAVTPSGCEDRARVKHHTRPIIRTGVVRITDQSITESRGVALGNNERFILTVMTTFQSDHCCSTRSAKPRVGQVLGEFDFRSS